MCEHQESGGDNVEFHFLKKNFTSSAAFSPIMLTLQSQTYSQRWYHFVTKVVYQNQKKGVYVQISINYVKFASFLILRVFGIS